MRWPVHSMNPTWTTISGRTQCARRRGRPLALVNGDWGISIASSRRRKLEQELGIEPCADLAGEHEIAVLLEADQERAKADAAALRVGEPADDQVGLQLALHLEPVRRSPVLVAGVPALGDHAFPPLAAGARPRLGVVDEIDVLQRRSQRQLAQPRRAALRAAAPAGRRPSTARRRRRSAALPRSSRRRGSARAQAAPPPRWQSPGSAAAADSGNTGGPRLPA